jgi:serine protease AprX
MDKLIFFSRLIIIFLIINVNKVIAQTQGKYLVKFKDKAGTIYSIDKPEAFLSKRAIDRRAKQGIKIVAHDLPPSKTYIDELKKIGATVWYTSRWYNGALVLADSALAAKIKALPFVAGFEANEALNLNESGKPARKKSKFEVELDTVNHGNGTVQARMIGANNLHNTGYKGNGMMIAVLDDGFNKVNVNSYMAHLFTNKKVAGTYDFVRNTPNVYDIGGHGNLVLSTMAANTDGKFVGTAPEASYVLLRSEDAPTEKLIEEANYLFAAEYADSVGVDIINSSLGYEDFDYSNYTHEREDFNGDKTLVTKAVDWAAATGILVCTSAGNSGTFGIAAPADADSVMAVGSVTFAELKSGFSSVGPTADGRIKPEVAAMGSGSTVSFVNASGTSVLATSSGTSFSGPIMAGFVACYWQSNPSLKNMEVIEAIKKLGTQAKNPDNQLGYGIPKFGKIVILENEPNFNIEVKVSPNPTKDILNINLPQEKAGQLYDFEMYNMLGQIVLVKNKVLGNSNFDLTNLKTGVYLTKIIFNKEIFTIKLMKE